jgi:erythromycin esterase-like protein
MFRNALQPLDGGAHDYDALLECIGDARFVFIGDATHGTHEHYRERARITRRLVEDLGFDAVAIEGDWPDASRVDRFVRGEGDDGDAEEALEGFRRFPTWLWRNTDVVDFIGWLRERGGIGFYGLDLYSMFASIDVVLRGLDRADPAAAARARERYACFDRFHHDTTSYGWTAALDVESSCEREVKAQLAEIIAHGDLPFDLEQNARLVKDAEAYYRALLSGATVTWNLRDRHMADTLGAIAQHLDVEKSRAARIVVWAHNSHVGDARATEMGRDGELTLGQLARERYGDDAFLVGMTTWAGTVTAAADWEEPPQRMNVRPAIDESYEALFHATGVPRFVVLPDAERRLPEALRHERLERAIGVVYRSETERVSHWIRARMGHQFDAVIHVDHTRAVEPIERHGEWSREAPETFPFAV